MTFRMDPCAKLYLLLLANLLLLFHVGTAAEAATTALCLLLFFLSSKIGMGLRLSALYFGLLAVDIFVVPRAGEGVLLNLLSLVSVGAPQHTQKGTKHEFDSTAAFPCDDCLHSL